MLQAEKFQIPTIKLKMSFSIPFTSVSIFLAFESVEHHSSTHRQKHYSNKTLTVKRYNSWQIK